MECIEDDQRLLYLMKTKSPNRELVVITLIILGVTFSYYVNSILPRLVLLIFLLAFFFTLKGNKKIASLFIMYPFSYILKVYPDQFSFFTICTIITSVTILYEIRRITLESLLLLLSLILLTVPRVTQDTLTLYIEWLGQILLLVLLFGTHKGNQILSKKTSYITYLVVGVFLSSSVALLFPDIIMIAGWSKNINIILETTITKRFAGLLWDPAAFSQIILLAQCLLLARVSKNKQNNSIAILCIFLLFGLGYITLSKMYYLYSTFVWLLLVSISLKSLTARFRVSLGRVVCLIVILCAVIISLLFSLDNVISFVSNILGSMLQRLRMGDFTTGRLEVQKHYLIHLTDSVPSFVFGYGMISGKKLAELLNTFTSPENLLIESLYLIGVAGTSILVLLMIWIFGKAVMMFDPLDYFALFMYVLTVFALPGLTSKSFSLILLLIFGAAFTKDKEMHCY